MISIFGFLIEEFAILRKTITHLLVFPRSSYLVSTEVNGLIDLELLSLLKIWFLIRHWSFLIWLMSVRRNLDGQPTKLLVGSNHDRKQNSDMIVTNRVTGKGHGGSEEDESRNNEDANRSPAELAEAQAFLQSQKQQWQQQQPQLPQGSVVRWDNFLPVKSLKVLLVENDDSTRHVVSALLRNCSYEVTAVSNGLEAWKILAGLTNHIGLVLTEVAMPGLSGIDLLSKIMGHKTYKNIPVVMMSSNDSMKIVFKCLSSGAVDFLVKPIRKNELKNLWQHVWRKCHSSSGSGSESGIRTQKSPQSRSVDGSDNNTDSNSEEDNGSTGLIYRNGSDNDSGTQSSCSKRAIEVHGPQMVSQWDDLSDPPDSTCAQVIYSRPEAQSTSWLATHATRKFQIEDDETDDAAMGKDLTIEAPRNSDIQLRTPSGEALVKVLSTGMDLHLEMKKDTKRQGKSMVDHNTQMAKDELKHNDKNVMAAVTDVSIPCRGSALNEVLTDPPKATKVKHRDPYDKKEPSLELSLQRLRDVGSSGTNSQERNVLRHSGHSAFSRYNNTSTSNQALTGNVGSCSPVDYSLGVGKTESIQHLKCNSSGTPNQGSNESSNNNDMGSTTNKASTKPESLKDNSVPRSTVSVHHYTFQQVQHNHCPSDQNMMPGVQDTMKAASNQAVGMHQQGQVEHHHHHHYHHHHHHVHSRQQQQQPLSSDELSSRNVPGEASHCRPSDKLEMGIEGNAANYGSGSGSNNGSNGQNGNSPAGITEGTNVANDAMVPGTCGTGSGSRSGLDQERLAMREAALLKFRQKRKERCFEKKVRYQSRKKLAEQRPRVRGQFVRQAVGENIFKDKSNNTGS